MIADVIPPFPTLLLILGAVLTLLGLTGQITIKEATMGIPRGACECWLELLE